MSIVTVEIDNPRDLNVLMAFLNSLGMKYSQKEEKQQTREELFRIIDNAGNPNFNLEERLRYLEECRQDRPMPNRD